MIWAFSFGLLWGGLGEKQESPDPSFQYIKSYRYAPMVSKKPVEFSEVGLLVEAMARLYFDFSSMGSRHFSQHPVDFLSENMKDINLVQAFMIFADRLARHMAYVPQIYEIDIKSGLAIDPFDMFVEK